MTDGNTHAIDRYLDEREGYDALQEVTAELEQAEARIDELEAKLAKAVGGLRDAAEDMDGYVGKGYGDPYRELTEELNNTEKGKK